MVIKKVEGILIDETIITDLTPNANEFHSKNKFGEVIEGNLHLSLIEGLYLIEKKKLTIFNKRNREITKKTFIKKAASTEPNFWTRYCTYKDLRNRGYIVKTALKFGADFRVYDRGVKPGQDHAKWIVYAVQESTGLTWYEFSAKNRVAHSTKKRLMVCVVDDEGDVSYWEIKWMRP